MGNISIEIDKDLCICCGNCEAIAPEIFKLDEDMKSSIQENATIDEEKALEAAKDCPAEAITVTNKETDERLWPK